MSATITKTYRSYVAAMAKAARHPGAVVSDPIQTLNGTIWKVKFSTSTGNKRSVYGTHSSTVDCVRKAVRERQGKDQVR